MSMLKGDYREHKSRMSSRIKMVLGSVTAIAAIVMIVAVTILANQKPNRHVAAEKAADVTTAEAPATKTEISSKWETLDSSNKKTSDQLNFWHMYDEDEEKTTIVPESKKELKDDKVEEPLPEETVSDNESLSDNEAEEGIDLSAQSLSRNSISGNFFDQNELSVGEPSFVPIISELKKNTLLKENFRMNGIFKEYTVNEAKTSYTGIDVSKYQGDIDWEKVSESGIDYAMVRMGARGYTSGKIIIDDHFEKNMAGCSENGIKTGIYFFSQAVTPEEAIEEANYCVAAIQNYKVEYPIVFDSEEVVNDSYRTQNIPPKQMSAVAQAFCNTISMYGYTPMIAATKKQFASRFEIGDIEAYDWWLFDTDETTVFPYRFNMWQYSKTGSIEGIVGAVDLDISFIDYSAK